MGREADKVVPYHSPALYILPLAAAYLFAVEVAKQKGVAGLEKIEQDLLALTVVEVVVGGQPDLVPPAVLIGHHGNRVSPLS